jgi:hypothetical protein
MIELAIAAVSYCASLRGPSANVYDGDGRYAGRAVCEGKVVTIRDRREQLIARVERRDRSIVVVGSNGRVILQIR